MADFRKWFLAFAAVALLLGMSSTANAQLGGGTTPSFQCAANAANPTIVRAEGLTELVGDLTLNCTGGSPTPLGAAIPLSNVTVFLNTNITSRLVSGNISEATLLIDDPHPATPVPANAVPPAGSPPQKLCTPVAVACPETGTFAGVGSVSPYQAQPNVFLGQQNSASSVVFLGVPIDAPGTTGVRVIRVTNVRANAFQLGVSSTLIPTQITMYIAVNGSQQILINNPTQTVALIQVGLIVSSQTSSLLQCTSSNEALLGVSGAPSPASDFNVTVKEGFAASFKRQNIVLSTDGKTVPTAIEQNVPGVAYNTETGFYSPTLFGALNVGLASQGTRILLRFNNLGAGVHIFVPTSVALDGPGETVTAPASCSGTTVLTATCSFPLSPPLGPGSAIPAGILYGQMNLTTSDVSGAGGYSFVAGTSGLAEVSYSGTTGYAAYEVLNSDPNSQESGTISVFVAYTSNTAQNLPAPGASTLNVSFAPLSSVGTASATDPIPRFGDSSAPLNTFDINLCTCDLLFPFVTNQSGFDTGIALANTSLDPFGTGPQQGTVKLYYFGSTAGGGVAPPPFTTQTVPAGQELIFNLSGGGNFGVPAVPGFEGYIISVANFQYCHAFAFISDVGAQKLAEGYLAIQLDFPFNLVPGGGSRTGVNGENEGH